MKTMNWEGYIGAITSKDGPVMEKVINKYSEIVFEKKVSYGSL